MALMYKKGNPTQGVLAAFFGIDQATVSRYIDVLDEVLEAVLPTATNISKEIARGHHDDSTARTVRCSSRPRHHAAQGEHQQILAGNREIPCRLIWRSKRYWTPTAAGRRVQYGLIWTLVFGTTFCIFFRIIMSLIYSQPPSCR